MQSPEKNAPMPKAPKRIMTDRQKAAFEAMVAKRDALVAERRAEKASKHAAEKQLKKDLRAHARSIVQDLELRAAAPVAWTDSDESDGDDDGHAMQATPPPPPTPVQAAHGLPTIDYERLAQAIAAAQQPAPAPVPEQVAPPPKRQRVARAKPAPPVQPPAPPSATNAQPIFSRPYQNISFV
jgi:hypothetical protein